MARLFRFASTARRDPAVEAWLADREGHLGDLARRWFGALRELGNDVTETLHDGQPTACVDDVALAYVDAFTAHVNVGFFHGSELPDPTGLLEGTGRFMRHVKLGPGREPDEAALAELLRAAHADLRARLAAE